MLDKILAKMDGQGRKMDDMISSLAATTSRLLGAAIDSTPISTATNKVPAVANAAPSADATLTDQAHIRCSRSGLDTNAGDLHVVAAFNPKTGVSMVAPAPVELSSTPTSKPFSTIKHDTQELLVIDDLLSALVGIEGQYISIQRTRGKECYVVFQIDSSVDLALQELTRRIFPLCEDFVLVSQFVESRSHFLTNVAATILATGKYLNAMRECGHNVQVPLSENAKLLSFGSNHQYLKCIKSVYGFASSELLALMKDKYDLLGKLRSLKHYLLLDEGDFLVPFMAIAREELTKKLEEIAALSKEDIIGSWIILQLLQLWLTEQGFHWLFMEVPWVSRAGKGSSKYEGITADQNDDVDCSCNKLLQNLPQAQNELLQWVEQYIVKDFYEQHFSSGNRDNDRATLRHRSWENTRVKCIDQYKMLRKGLLKFSTANLCSILMYKFNSLAQFSGADLSCSGMLINNEQGVDQVSSSHLRFSRCKFLGFHAANIEGIMSTRMEFLLAKELQLPWDPGEQRRNPTLRG